MHTILIITQRPPLTERVRSLLSDGWRLVHRNGTERSEPLIKHGLVQAVILDVSELDVQGIWQLEAIRRWGPSVPIFLYTQETHWELDQEAYEKGAAHIFTGNLKARVLNVFLERGLNSYRTRQIRDSAGTFGESANWNAERDETSLATMSYQGGMNHVEPPRRALEMARDFASVLTHSLSVESLLDHFLVLLRDLLGINRAAVFCREFAGGNPGASRDSAPPTIIPLRSSVGLSSEMAECLKLTSEAGIGSHLLNHGRILRRDSLIVRQDRGMQSEFDLIGGQIAIPILDPNAVIGVIIMDGRVTGEPILNSELELIYQMFEHLGVAIKTLGKHGRLAANHSMLTQMLHKMTYACIVVSDDLVIQHANALARRLFKMGSRRGEEPDFSEIPEELGSKMYQVLQTRTGIEPFAYHPGNDPRKFYQISILPIEGEEPDAKRCVMAVVEDRTQNEQLKQLEIETSSLRLVKNMSERLAHEIGNALVPLATHEQLLSQKYDDEEFRESLTATMTDGVKRISRLAKQMFFLARERFECTEKIPLRKLIDEAFLAARDFHSSPNASLKLVNGDDSLTVNCDAAGLKYALAEVMLNALQANPAQSQVRVEAQSRVNGCGIDVIELKVSDGGEGFSEETARRATEPFYSTRTVGIGLGLTVADKIIGRHHGNLRVAASNGKGPRCVEILLPTGES